MLVLSFLIYVLFDFRCLRSSFQFRTLRTQSHLSMVCRSATAPGPNFPKMERAISSVRFRSAAYGNRSHCSASAPRQANSRLPAALCGRAAVDTVIEVSDRSRQLSNLSHQRCSHRPRSLLDAPWISIRFSVRDNVAAPGLNWSVSEAFKWRERVRDAI